jgi:hypothetical protein
MKTTNVSANQVIMIMVYNFAANAISPAKNVLVMHEEIVSNAD